MGWTAFTCCPKFGVQRRAPVSVTEMYGVARTPNFRQLSVIGSGGADRDRTGDPLVANQVLSQLSYSPILVVGGWWLVAS